MWVQVSAGAAPVESCRFVYLFLQLMQKECIDKNIKLELMSYVEGEEKNTIKSALLKLTGEKSKKYAKSIEGSMLWICKSEFRPNHKRKNWFIEVELFDSQEEVDMNLKEIKVETMRSSGSGGQNVNKLETGVRVTHLLTGITVKAQEERSQHQNKKLAFARLKRKLEQLQQEQGKKLDQKRWQKHQEIQRGNPIRVFKDREFTEIKDC